MRRWSPRLDWEHLQNWLPGVLGGSAAILLVVIAANFPTQTNSRPAELPASQTTAVATRGPSEAPSPTKPALPQISPVAGTGAKAQSPAQSTSPAPATTTGDVAMSAPAHDHAMVKAEAAVPPAPVQGSASPDKEPQKAVANAAGLQGDAAPGARFSRNVRRVILWSLARPSWVRASPGLSTASRALNRISIIRRQ